MSKKITFGNLADQEESEKVFYFDHEPTFAELWDKCVYGLLYDVDEYKQDLEVLFEKLGITRDSDIIDVSAGGGFPSLDLSKDGYKIVCTDGFEDEVELFNSKAKKAGVGALCRKLLWNELSVAFPDNRFDFLFCRGNSFIYAGGGWNSMVTIEIKKVLDDYRRTLSEFYGLLKPEGWIYVDKFKDTETTHKEKVCEIKVGDNLSEELIFWTQRFPEQKVRQASMIRKIGNEEKQVPNITYDLSEQELEMLFLEVGFKNVRKIELPSEENFNIWIAQK